MSKLLDANAISRFLVNDIPEQAEIVTKTICAGAFTKEAVIAEVIYVLNRVYNLNRAKIAEELLLLLELVEIENSEVIEFAINLFAESTLDFVDCLLISYHKIQGIEVFSFDKKLNNRLK